MEPIISVIVPTHNIIENGCEDAFNLMLGLMDLQTYPHIELIVIDNASTDGTRELLSDYKNKGYLTFYSEPDSSKVNAMNKGVMRSKAKYISFIGVEDFYHDITGIIDAISVMEQNNGDFLYSPSYCRHPDGYTFLFQPTILNAFQVPPCARQGMIFRKSAIEQIGYFDERFRIMADMDLIIRLLARRARPINFQMNFTTYKMNKASVEHPERANAELRGIYMKNYRSLYPFTEAEAEQMVMTGTFPAPLLEKLSGFFPKEDKELFYELCEKLSQIRKTYRAR